MLIIPRLLGHWLGQYLTQPNSARAIGTPTARGKLANALQPCDVLLIEGDFRISSAIKYLSQSTWSHAAMYIGPVLGSSEEGEPFLFIEADLIKGVRKATLSEYAKYHSRICRAKNLTDEDKKTIIAYMQGQLGRQYDLKNVFDLARYMLPIPVPARWRRRMISLGSGDPTKAICSSLIAEAFHRVRYPIMPLIQKTFRIHIEGSSERNLEAEETLAQKHQSLYTPRDFDVSPYFEIIKPTLVDGFDYKELQWNNLSE